MKVTLIDYTENAKEKLIYTKATRLTQGGETRQRVFDMSDLDKHLELQYMANTVPSSWEFVSYTFEIIGVSRAFTHQLVRTRTGSYAQQAMRICDMKGFGYYTGPSIKADRKAQEQYDRTMKLIQVGYDQLLSMGVKVEDARGVLPTNILTNIIARFNLRAFSDLVKKRTSLRVQNEYREFMDKAIERVLEVHPWAESFLFPNKMKMIKKLQEFISMTESSNEDKLYHLKLLDQLKG